MLKCEIADTGAGVCSSCSLLGRSIAFVVTVSSTRSLVHLQSMYPETHSDAPSVLPPTLIDSCPPLHYQKSFQVQPNFILSQISSLVHVPCISCLASISFLSWPHERLIAFCFPWSRGDMTCLGKWDMNRSNVCHVVWAVHCWSVASLPSFLLWCHGTHVHVEGPSHPRSL